MQSLNLVFLRKNNDKTNTFQCGTICIGTNYDGGNLGNAFFRRVLCMHYIFLHYLHLWYLTILHWWFFVWPNLFNIKKFQFGSQICAEFLRIWKTCHPRSDGAPLEKWLYNRSYLTIGRLRGLSCHEFLLLCTKDIE